MRLGPFRSFDIKDVEELLKANKIGFSLFIDKELEKKILNDFNVAATPAPRATAGHLNLSIFYFDIADGDFEKVKKDFEKYGVVAASDGSYELGEED